jgi:hypothetical protein
MFEDTTTILEMPFDGFIIVEVIGANAVGRHSLYLRQPSNSIIIENPASNIGSVWQSGIFNKGTLLDFGLWFWGYENIPSQWESGAIRTIQSNHTYIFGFDDSDLDSDFNDIIILVSLIRECNPQDPNYVTSNIPNQFIITSTTWLDIATWVMACDDRVKLNESDVFSAKIVDGKEYGNLINYASMQIGEEIQNILPEEDQAIFGFSSIFTDNNSNFNVRIRISSTINNTVSYDINLLIIPPILKVDFEPDEIKPGDTSNIKLSIVNLDGGELEPPPDMNFISYIISDSLFGNLCDPASNQIGFELFNVKNGFKFIADAEIHADSVENDVFVEEFKDDVIITKSKAGSDYVTNELIVNGIGTIKIVKPKIEIMLGETKYLGLKKKEKSGRTTYQLAEIPTDYGEEPEFPADADGWTWIKGKDVWGDDPVEITGSKSGIYWEKKYFDGTSNDNKDLAEGMIRIVGRFWEDGLEESFKVILKAIYEGKEIKIIVNTIKPNLLGNDHHVESNAEGNSYNLDDKIIKYSGRFGVPPQLIKGDIEQESINFNPSYRYEPFFDAYYIHYNEGRSSIDPFLKDASKYKIVNLDGNPDLGNPGIPTNHSNIHIDQSPNNPVNYPTGGLTVYEYIYENCKDINPLASRNLYPKNRKNWSKSCLTGWNKIYESKRKTLHKVNKYFKDLFGFLILEPLQIPNIARASANYWLKNVKWNGVMGKSIAQTRIAASYGLMQVMFTSAVAYRNYPSNNSNYWPERLNETDINLYYGITFITDLLTLHAKVESEDNNWALGYESSFELALSRYNERDNYPSEVVDKSKSYLPVN